MGILFDLLQVLVSYGASLRSDLKPGCEVCARAVQVPRMPSRLRRQQEPSAGVLPQQSAEHWKLQLTKYPEMMLLLACPLSSGSLCAEVIQSIARADMIIRLCQIFSDRGGILNSGMLQVMVAFLPTEFQLCRPCSPHLTGAVKVWSEVATWCAYHNGCVPLTIL